MDKKRPVLSHALTALIAVVLTLGIVLGCLFAWAGSLENLKRGAKLTQILHVLDREFVVEADLDAAVDLAAAGMIQSLDDRWSYYMTADQYSAYLLRTQNNYRGIGVTVTACEEGFLLADVARDTPAYEAGLLPGEKLTAIDGEALSGWTTQQLQERIQSYEGERFTLEVMDGEGALRSVTLGTATVYSSPVSSELLEGNVGYILLKNFSAGCADDAIAAVDSLMEQGAQALIFDVRYNGGGYVHELTALLDYLLPEGDIFVSRDRAGKETVTTSDPDHIDLPMAVLINSESYSAAELFAAQLSEFGAAVTVGEATTGKGRSQVSYTLMDGSAVHISHEAYLTSQRRDLAAEGGILPDVAVDLTDEEAGLLYYKMLPPEDDPQLQAALAALR